MSRRFSIKVDGEFVEGIGPNEGQQLLNQLGAGIERAFTQASNTIDPASVRVTPFRTVDTGAVSFRVDFYPTELLRRTLPITAAEIQEVFQAPGSDLLFERIEVTGLDAGIPTDNQYDQEPFTGPFDRRD